MRTTKRLWKDEEIIGMPRTLEILRKMRTASSTLKNGNFTKLKVSLNNLFGGEAQAYSQGEALKSAEELANAAGDFFAAKLSRTSKGRREFDKWQELLLEAEKNFLHTIKQHILEQRLKK